MLKVIAQTKTTIYVSSLVTMFAAASCGNRRASEEPSHRAVSEPIVTSAEVKSEPKITSNTPAGNQDKANEALVFVDSNSAAATPASEHVSGQITLKKSEVLNRTFLYGFDLQYSATGDAKLSLLNQSQALGHIPATFRQLGDKLQLIADNRRLFESEVNHPETLINEYKINRETDTELTITMDSPGMLVHKSVNGADSKAPLKTWLRSIEFVADGNYLLQESALMLENGEVQTYMESFFPRDTLVPADYVAIEDNRDKNPDSARFMFIGNEKVYVERSKTNGVPVREQTQFANRFRLATDKSTIDWYVTPNAPDDLLKEIQSGIEGWNRYFHEELGRDVMVFKGRLPSGIKIGDPRYNVVNFDSVAQAGAAYESQASDPTTGIQSHSIVYMPYAWYNIAAKLATSRETPDPAKVALTAASIGPKSPEVLFGQAHKVLACVREADEVASGPSQSSLAVAKDDAERKKIVDDFGRRVFISTLFHEVGHALGLGHNFKGSLAFDGSKPVSVSNQTSYSVMDYNYYQHEIDLFHAIGTSDGPKLEYDRQIISFLYNNGKDIKPTDAKIAACNDDDADGVDGGVDPDCIRYDSESNPILGLDHAVARFKEASGAMGIDQFTLAQVLSDQRDRLASKLSDTAKVPDAKAAEKAVTQAAKDIAASIGYYVTDGAQSVRVNLALNAVSLREWSSDPEDDGIKMPEVERRKKYLSALTLAIASPELSPAAADIVKGTKDLLSAIILQSDRFGAQSDRGELVKKLSSSIDSAVAKALKDSFAKLRTSVAAKLVTGSGTAPFSDFADDSKSMEQVSVAALRKMVVLDLSVSDIGSALVQKSRIDAAKALVTFKKLGDDYNDEIGATKAELVNIRNGARQAGKQDVLDYVRTLLGML